MKPAHNIAGVILAAGASSRMGRPKALLELADGETLLSRQATLLKDAGCREIIVVVGANMEEIESRHADLDVKWVANADWKRGQFSSVQAGIRDALKADADGVLLLPVDVAGVAKETVQAIAQAARANPHLDAIVPEHEGRGGHPVWLSRDFCRRLASADPDSRLDLEIGRSLRAMRLPVCDPNTARNINTPGELKML